MEAYEGARRRLSEILSAAEMFDLESLRCVLAHLPAKQRPLEAEYPFYLLLETRGSSDVHDREKSEIFLSDVLSSSETGDGVLDGVLATDERRQKDIWSLRENITLAVSKSGFV